MTDRILEDLNGIISDWTGCTDCGLHEGRKSQVWFRAEGEIDKSGIMIIGEAAGADEDRHGIPFVGKAGAKLNRLLVDADIVDVFITNTVLCRPPNNRNPKRSELRACWPRLQRMIEVMEPSVIVCLGNVPAHWLLETDKSMRAMSGRVFDWSLGNILKAKVLPIYHPSYLLRQQSGALDNFVVERLGLAKRMAGHD